MENDLQVKYDSLCYTTFLNIRHLTKDADRIALKGVDWKNLEHRFVVHIVNACYNILGARDVVMDAGPLTRSTIARACRSFGKVRKIREDDTVFVDVPELLEFMRGAACELCGTEFTFGNIYNEYYSGKEEK
jgi:hypothetical protein